ncbi:MAG: hypothetical protein JRI36_06965 [Deltaproteobacteria bacterium]|nr:hypothetical protein [Deltaproteobacteria bacterium]
MTEKKIEMQKTNTTTMIGLVVLLGLGACTIMFGIVSWTLSSLRADREGLDRLQADMSHMVTALDTYQIQARQDISALLSETGAPHSDSHHADRLYQVINSYQSRAPGHAQGVTAAAARLRGNIAAVEEMRKDCLDWNRRQSRLVSDFPVVRQKVNHILAEMRSAVASAEGRVRLGRAIEVRRYHEAKGRRVQGLARKIIQDIGSEAGLAATKTELADLALLSERLVGEDEPDHLADLRGNQFKPALNRLEGILSRLEGVKLLPSVIRTSLLVELESALFGQSLQTDVAGRQDGVSKGLYGLCWDRLALRKEGRQLQKRAMGLFDAFGAARQRLVEEVERHANYTAASAEKRLRRAWLFMLMVGMACMGLFLTLAGRIARTVKNQVVAIEEANADLTAEVSRRRRVEGALRRSEEALRGAKDQLEVRVEERTAELEEANQRLKAQVRKRKRIEEELRLRGKELAEALASAQKARELAENERDKSKSMLAEVSESKRRLEILISDATAREMRMIELKREVNALLAQLGKQGKYNAPAQVDSFLSTGQPPNVGLS